MKLNTYRRLWVTSLFVLMAWSCSRTPIRPPASFSGTVTLDGQPLESGSIQFTSLFSGEAAYVNLDSSGHFNVEFPEADVGTSYDVTVGPPIQEIDAIDAMSAPKSKSASKVPVRYANRGTSKLSAQLHQAGENAVNFDLTTE